MINNKLFQELLNKDMTRKQFLQVIMAGILSIVGFTAFLNNLDKFARTNTQQNESKRVADRGYGSSPYGR